MKRPHTHISEFDSDAALLSQRDIHARQYPEYAAEAEAARRDTASSLQGQTILSLDFGLYDQQGLLLRPRTPTLSKEFFGTLTLRVGECKPVSLPFVAARLYPNKKHLRAAATHKQGQQPTAILLLNPAYRQTIRVQLDWFILGNTSEPFVTIQTTILPPSGPEAIELGQIIAFSHKNYVGEWHRNPNPVLSTWHGHSMKRRLQRQNDSGGYLFNYYVL